MGASPMGEITAPTSKPDTQLFRDVFNASPIGIAIENLDGQPLFVNPAFCSFLGFSEEELRNKHCVDFSPREDSEKDWALFQQLRAGSIDHYQLEKRYFRRDGSLVWGRLSISLLKSRPSALVIAMVEDITDKKRAEEALRTSKEKFSKAFRQSPLALTLTRISDHVFLDVNATFERLSGWRRDEVIGRSVFDIGIWVDPAQRTEFVKRVLAEGAVRDWEVRYRQKDGGERAVLSSAELIEIGNETCLLLVIADICDRKRAEEALRDSEERLRLAQQAARIGTFEWNIRTGVNTWTPELESMYGLPPGGFGGTQTAFENLIHPDDCAGVIELNKWALKTGKPTNGEWRVVWPDGSVHWIAGRWQVYMNE